MSANRPNARSDGEAGTGEILRRAIQTILDDAQAALENRRSKPTTIIHALRVALKRWRAAAELLSELLPSSESPAVERSRRQARALARRLASARDLQAALDALSDLGKGDRALPAARMRPLVERLVKLRGAAETSSTLHAARRALAVWIGAGRTASRAWSCGELAHADLVASAGRGYRRARRRIPEDWSGADAEELHRLRQRVVAHYDQLELIGMLTPARMARRQHDLHRLRAHLGADHDLQVLAGLAASRRPLARWRSRLAPAVAARQSEHRAAARRLCRRLFKGGRAAFQRAFAEPPAGGRA